MWDKWEKLLVTLHDWLPWKESSRMVEVQQELDHAKEGVLEELRKSGLEKGYEELAQRYKRDARKY